jgi:membrane-bound lytic murein transglycosylase F
MHSIVKIFLIVIFSFCLFAFGWISHSKYQPKLLAKKPSLLDKIKKTKKLNVVLLNAPTTYYIGKDTPKGFEYDLLNDYAKHLGVELNITTADTVKEAIELSFNPNIYITSASLAKTKEREKRFNFGPSYFEVQEQVICNRNIIRSGRFPRDVEDLSEFRIAVGEDTSYSETIKNLQKDGFEINAIVDSKLSTEELLEEVAEHKIDCTIVDSNIYMLNQRYLPQIALAFTISGREQLAWVLALNSKELESDMYEWFNSYNQSGKLAQLKDHYYSYAHFFDYYNNQIFYKRIKTRLPKYEKYFKKYGKKYDIPWTLLAAISYQESHWNPKAKSFTGVRGLMMLTRSTAKMLGVKNRLDVEQSVEGGAKHLRQMLKSVPKDVVGENRLKFALAAYNIGLAHILDARALARKMDLNPTVWSDLKKVLPLLSQKRYYQGLRFGYARGSEPVKYVDFVYDFMDILQKLEDDKNKPKELDVDDNITKDTNNSNQLKGSK